MNSTSLLAFKDELEKISARAGFRLIKNLFSKGTSGALEQASRLAKTPGVLKPSAMGSHIKHLGGGSEGIADLVAHPEHGVAVRKLYDPTSAIASPMMVGRKLQMSKVVDSPRLAKTYGFARTGRGGRATFHEYVPGGEPGRRAEATIKEELQRAGASKGYQLEDIRKANIRGEKAIDVLPMHKGEAEGMGGMAGNVLNLTESGLRKFTPYMKKAIGRSEQGLNKEQLYRLIGGGSKGRALSQIKSAPARAPLTLPRRAAPAPVRMPLIEGGVPTAPLGPKPTPTVSL